MHLQRLSIVVSKKITLTWIDSMLDVEKCTSTPLHRVWILTQCVVGPSWLVGCHVFFVHDNWWCWKVLVAGRCYFTPFCHPILTPPLECGTLQHQGMKSWCFCVYVGFATNWKHPTCKQLGDPANYPVMHDPCMCSTPHGHRLNS